MEDGRLILLVAGLVLIAISVSSAVYSIWRGQHVGKFKPPEHLQQSYEYWNKYLNDAVGKATKQTTSQQ